MKKAIASIAFKRPDYFKQHLEGLLSQNWKRDTDYFVFIDGPKNESDVGGVAEVSKLARDFISKTWVNLFPNYNIEEQKENKGCDYQVLHVVKNILVEREYDQVIIVEEDVIPLRGFLEWMEFGLTLVHSGEAQSVCAFSFPANKVENPLLYKKRMWFMPWGWATTREQWMRIFSDGCGDKRGWDWYVADRYVEHGLEEVYPVVPRTKNIGKVGFHQDGVTKYPELEERLTTSNDYPLVTSGFVEMVVDEKGDPRIKARNVFNMRKDYLWAREGWMLNEEVEVLYNEAVKMRRGCIVEIGAFKGKSTACFLIGSNDGNKVPVYSIDPYLKYPEYNFDMVSVEKTFHATVKECKQNVKHTLYKAKSEDVHGNFKDGTIGLLLIDGSHTYENAKKDIDNYLPKVMKGGTILMHDAYSPGFEGVGKAIDEAVAAKKLDKVGIIRTLCILKVI